MTCLKNIQKNRDKILKYVILIANVLYIIGLAITSIVMGDNKTLSKEMAISFSAPFLSLFITFLKTESIDIVELSKQIKKIIPESDEIVVEQCINDIATCLNSARSIHIEQPTTETTEPTEQPTIDNPDLIMMNIYYDKKTSEFIKITPRTPRVPRLTSV